MKIKEFLNKHLYLSLFISLTLLALVLFSPYLLGIREFVFDTDQWIEYRFMYEQWDRMIDKFLYDGTLPFYSFNSFLGNDFYSSKAFYITGDFFFPIVRLFPNIVDGLKFETIACFVISGLSFALLAKEFGIKQNKYIYLGSFVYALTSMASIFCGVYMFYRFYCFMPLIFYAIECYRNKHRYWIFPIAIAQAWISCFYLMIPTTLFMPIYFIFSYYYHNEGIKLKEILMKALGAIGLYGIGFLISSILVVPALMNTLSNPRVANGYQKWYLPFDHHVLTSFMSGLVTPGINVSSKIPYLFESGFDGHLSRFSTFVNPLLSLGFITTVWTSQNNHHSIKIMRNTALILGLIMLIKPINMMFHGLSEPSMRYIFVPLTILLLMSLALFDNALIDKNRLIKGSKIYVMIVCALLIFTIIIDKVNILTFSFNITLILTSCLLLLILVRYYLNHNMNKSLLIALIVINAISFEARLLNMSSTYYPYTDSLDKELIAYNAYYDSDRFFRIWIDPSKMMPTSPMNLNQSMHFNYRSTSNYDSCYEQNLNDFLALNGLDWNRLIIDDPQALRMLGVKYWYVTDESELPKEFEFTYVTNINHYQVYQLDNYRPLGFTYTKYVTDKTNKPDWNNALIIEQDLANLVQSSEENHSVDMQLVDYRNDNYLYGEIALTQESVLFTSIPYNKGWIVLDQDQQIETYKVQGGFVGVHLKPGQHFLTFIFIPPGYSLGNKLTAVGISIYLGLIIISVLKKKVFKNDYKRYLQR